jgi:hypothetical protein
MHVFATFVFNGFEISIISVFFDTIIYFCLKKLIGSNQHLFETFKTNEQSWAQKTKHVFLNSVLELSFRTIDDIGKPSC